MNFIGIRAFYERKARLLNSMPLAVVENDFVIDCDTAAWNCGVRPGDTVRQSKIASPRCQIIRVRDLSDATAALKGVLDALSLISPYIEPSSDWRGVFVDVTPGTVVSNIISSFKTVAGGGGFPFHRAFVGRNDTKLLAKAACSWLSREYANGKRIFPGKTAWGHVEQGEGYLLASVDRGRERTFLSGSAIESLWPAPSEVLGDLRSLGLKKVKEIREVPLAGLSRHIGDWAYPVKKWAEGEDASTVKALYPPPCIFREMNYEEPVMPDKEMFDSALQGLSGELVEKGLGFRTLRILVSRDSGMFSRERKFLRPVSSQDAMITAVHAMLDEEFFQSDGNGPHPSVSSFSIHLGEIVSVQIKPLSLFGRDTYEVKKAMPVSLGLAIAGIEQKFGGEALSWGRSEERNSGFTPEIARREKMLSVWDPMRHEFSIGADDACQR